MSEISVTEYGSCVQYLLLLATSLVSKLFPLCSLDSVSPLTPWELLFLTYLFFAYPRMLKILTILFLIEPPSAFKTQVLCALWFFACGRVSRGHCRFGGPKTPALTVLQIYGFFCGSSLGNDSIVSPVPEATYADFVPVISHILPFTVRRKLLMFGYPLIER